MDAAALLVTEQESGSFLKKRTKKLFALGPAWPVGARPVAKVFWFFFSKKNRFLSYLAMSDGSQSRWPEATQSWIAAVLRSLCVSQKPAPRSSAMTRSAAILPRALSIGGSSDIASLVRSAS
jgi:hypothetical protein